MYVVSPTLLTVLAVIVTDSNTRFTIGGRKEAACCDIPIQANCSVDLCEVYQGYCPDPDSDVEDEPSSITNDKRALKRGNFSYVFGDDDDPDLVEDQLRNLERRGSQQRKWINFIDVNGVAHVFSYIIAGWYSYNEIFNHQPWNPQDPNHLPEQVFQAENPNDCTDLTVKGFTFNTPLPPQNPAGHTEHVIDVSTSLPLTQPGAAMACL